MTLEQQHSAGSVNAVGVALSGVVGASWVGWLPPLVALVASLFAIAWYAIQIWESGTVQKWRRSSDAKASQVRPDE
jgi:hypothetical protein